MLKRRNKGLKGIAEREREKAQLKLECHQAFVELADTIVECIQFNNGRVRGSSFSSSDSGGEE